MGKTLAFFGKIGAGKNTLCNFLHGYQLKSYDKISDFDLDEKGELIVSALDESGSTVKAMIDTFTEDAAMAEWCAYNMWPYVKQYKFAEDLKKICVNLFGIERHKIYGTHEQKNELTNIKWENIPGFIRTPDDKTSMEEIYGNLDAHGISDKVKFHDGGYMSGRQFMQVFATEIMRAIKDDIWVEPVIRRIKEEDSQLSIITDGRFTNELKAIKDIGGKSIYLTRSLVDDNHVGENQVGQNDCDAFIDNQNLSLLDTCKELINILEGWGWMENA
jgi:hypothetical protein